MTDPVKSHAARAAHCRDVALKAIPLLAAGVTLRAAAERFGIHPDKLSLAVREERARLGIAAPPKLPKAVRKPSGTPCFGEKYRRKS